MTIAPVGRSDPIVLRIAAADVAEALVRGLRDFQAQPLFGLLFGALYAAGGILTVLSVTAFGAAYLAYPLAAGFALLGPFVAIGLYEVSRCREAGRVPTLRDIWFTMRSRGEIGWMAFVTLFIFIVWMYQVRLLIALFLGVNTSFSSLQEFIVTVLTTSEGLIFLLIGNMIGAALALISVFSDGGLVSAAARPGRRFRHRHDHECARGRCEPGADDRLGRDHRGASGRLMPAVLPRAARHAAGARSHDMASLPTRRRAVRRMRSCNALSVHCGKCCGAGEACSDGGQIVAAPVDARTVRETCGRLPADPHSMDDLT